MTKYSKGYFVRNNIIYVIGTINKKRHRLSTGKTATKENLAWIRRNAPDVLLQLVSKPDIKSVKDFGLFSLEANSHQRKESTQKEYLSCFELYILPSFGCVSIADIKPMDLNAWQSRLLKQGLSPNTVRNARAVFRGILNDAYMNELIDRNPFDRVRAPKITPHEVRPFTKAEVELLIAEAGGWFSNFLRVAFFTGLRSGEILGLRWEDINFQSGYLLVRRAIREGVVSEPKTVSSIREVEISPSVISALKAEWQDTGLKQAGFVFLTEAGTPHHSTGNITARHWKPLLKRLLFDYRELYQTRHTFASLMISAGVDVVTVARLLGHKTTRMTLERYARFVPGKKDIIANALDDSCTHYCTQSQNVKVGGL